jgi:hypothetical protein
MKTFFVRYLNEIVGLTVMGLMALAFVAAQADADIHRAAVEEARNVVEIRLSAVD